MHDGSADLVTQYLYSFVPKSKNILHLKYFLLFLGGKHSLTENFIAADHYSYVACYSAVCSNEPFRTKDHLLAANFIGVFGNNSKERRKKGLKYIGS